MPDYPIFFILSVFLLGCTVGFLANSIYRAFALSRIKQAFEDKLRASLEAHMQATTAKAWAREQNSSVLLQ